MRKRIMPAVALAAAVLLVTSCTTSGTSTTQQDDSGPVNLTLWLTGSDDELTVIQAAADQYKKSHPDTTITAQSISWTDGHAKVLTAATSKVGPDIMAGGMSWGIEFGELGGMIDLQAYDVADIQSQTPSGVWNSIISRSGNVYGIPLDMSIYVMYYRTDVFADAGITTPPTTWEELIVALDKLSAAGVKYPFVYDWGIYEWISYYSFLTQAGGSLYDSDCTKATIDSEAGVKAAELWASLHEDYGAPTSAIDVAAGLASGDIGMAQSGSWLMVGMETRQPTLTGNWSTFTLPSGTQSGSFTGGRILGVMSYSQHIDASVEFIKYLYTDEAVTTMQHAAATKNLLWLAPRADMVSTLDVEQNWKDTLTQGMSTATGPPNCEGWEASSTEVSTQLQTIVANGADPKSALKQAASIMNSNL